MFKKVFLTILATNEPMHANHAKIATWRAKDYLDRLLGKYSCSSDRGDL
jgi:hypothetical protein